MKHLERRGKEVASIRSSPCDTPHKSEVSSAPKSLRTVSPPPCENRKCDPHGHEPLPPHYCAHHLAWIYDECLAQPCRDPTEQNSTNNHKKSSSKSRAIASVRRTASSLRRNIGERARGVEGVDFSGDNLKIIQTFFMLPLILQASSNSTPRCFTIITFFL